MLVLYHYVWAGVSDSKVLEEIPAAKYILPRWREFVQEEKDKMVLDIEYCVRMLPRPYVDKKHYKQRLLELDVRRTSEPDLRWFLPNLQRRRVSAIKLTPRGQEVEIWV